MKLRNKKKEEPVYSDFTSSMERIKAQNERYENKKDDFIQQAVNNAFDLSLKRQQKKIAYKIQLSNRRRNINKVKRKVERQNRKNMRAKCYKKN